MKNPVIKIFILLLIILYLTYGFYQIKNPSLSPNVQNLEAGRNLAVKIVSGEIQIEELSEQEISVIPGITKASSNEITDFQQNKGGYKVADPCTIKQLTIGKITYSPKGLCKAACIACALGSPACSSSASQQWYKNHILWCLNPLNSILV